MTDENTDVSSQLAQKVDSIRSLARMLLGTAELAGLKRTLVQGALGTFGLKVAGTGLSFLVSLILARSLGPAGYGSYNYAFSWIVVLSVPALLGLGMLMIREMSAYETQGQWRLMAGLLQWSNRAVLTTSIGLALVAGGVVWILESQLATTNLVTFWVALLILPLLAVMRVKQSAVQGLNKVVRSQVPELVILPLALVLLLAVTYVLPGVRLTATFAMGLNVLATAIALGASIYFLRRTVPEAAEKAEPHYDRSSWLRSGLVLLITNSVHVISSRADILMLGVLATPEDVGVYSVVTRAADLIMFVLIPINRVLGPVASRFYAEGAMDRLQKIVTKSARILLLLSLPIALGFITLGYWFLMLYGTEYTQGSTALAILSTGQLINVAMGSVGLLLNMTDNERYVASAIGAGATLNIILNLILIPKWGIEGAAFATASSTAFWNVLLAILIVRKTGIHATALGVISHR